MIIKLSFYNMIEYLDCSAPSAIDLQAVVWSEQHSSFIVRSMFLGIGLDIDRQRKTVLIVVPTVSAISLQQEYRRTYVRGIIKS